VLHKKTFIAFPWEAAIFVYSWPSSEALVPVNVFVGDLAVLELHHDDNRELDGFVYRRHPG
jgi:hypothetical protein